MKYSGQTMKHLRFLPIMIYQVLSGGYLAEIDTPEESEAVWEKYYQKIIKKSCRKKIRNKNKKNKKK